MKSYLFRKKETNSIRDYVKLLSTCVQLIDMDILQNTYNTNTNNKVCNNMNS